MTARRQTMAVTSVKSIEMLEQRLLFAVPPLLNPLAQPKFVNPLPLPGVIDAKAGGTYEIGITQFTQQLGLYAPDGTPLTTTVWGYQGSYPGPTLEVRKGTPIEVKWVNGLMQNGQPLGHLLPVDTSLHWAFNGHNGASYTIANDGVPVVTHLHGGHVEAASDGGPDAWFTPGFAVTGPAFEKQTYYYVNDQEAATLWYHDHALGITRLNVYAGLAGFYLVRDELDTGMDDDPATAVNENPLGLPTGQYEIALAIQDRMFTAEGQLYIPSAAPVPGAPEPSVLPEFFGDTILVNGQAWPFAEVEPRTYRLRLLNGSDSRFYNLTLPGVSFLQIGTDQGLLPAPVMVPRLTLGPGERADVIVDFSRLAGRTIIMTNDAKTPFPKGSAVDPRTTGQIMAFKVGRTVTKAPVPLARSFTTIEPLVQSGPTRQLALFEMMDDYGRLMPMLGTVQDGALKWDDPTTEKPLLGDTEVWEIYNNTVDAHPIHLHLVKFQVISRQKFTATVDPESGEMSNIRLIGRPTPPPANEAGWKDTVLMMPGEVTRIIATYDKPGGYVWHCHILSHEDHEMMRRLEVVEPSETLAGQVELPAQRRNVFSNVTVATPGVLVLPTRGDARKESVIDELLKDLV